MKVVIVEDHSVLLYGLVEILENKLNISSVKGFCTPVKAEMEINWLTIDLLVTDLEFKDGDSGIHLAKRLKLQFPDLKIIAYSSHKIFSILNELKKNGFNSYVCKEMPVKELLGVVEMVIRQSPKTFFESNSFKTFMHERKTVEKKFFTSNYERNISLTPTENMVCERIVENPRKDNTELAKHLNMQLNTLKKHITSIYKKLDVHSKEGIMLRIKGESLKC